MSFDLSKLEREIPPQFMDQIAEVILRAVTRSFAEFPLPLHTQHMTGAEAVRRAEWCVNHALGLRRERKATVVQIADSLPLALRYALRHGECEPQAETFWHVEG